jgi:hypothetical protein
VAEAADLFASLGLRVDQSSFSRGDAAIAGAKRSIDALDGAFQDRGGKWRAASGRYLTVGEKARLAATGVKGLGDEAEKAGDKTARAGKRGEGAFAGIGTAAKAAAAYLGFRVAVDGLIKFNSTAEDARNQIAGMLALTKKTDLADQLAPADALMASLAKKAATLSGTTAEYVKMLGNLTQPVTAAGLGMQDLEDITVGAVEAAKALGEQADVAARDVGQALRGQAGADDPFIGKLLDTAGFSGQEGRARFNQKAAPERAQIVKGLFTSPQIKQLGEAQGKTFTGLLSTLEDSISTFFGKVGKPLFDGLATAIRDVNAWLVINRETVNEVAAVIGGALSTAFDVFKIATAGAVEVIGFFVENSDLLVAILASIVIVTTALNLQLIITKVQAALAWLAMMGPIALIGTAIAGVIYLFIQLAKHPDKVREAFAAMGRAIVAAVDWVIGKVESIGARIADFFTDDIPNAIRAAFEFLENAPVIGRLIKLIQSIHNLVTSEPDKEQEKLDGATLSPDAFRAKYRYYNVDPSFRRPELPASPTDARGGTTIGNVSIPITVTSPNADPKAVATETRKAFDEHWNNKMRRAMDSQ